MPSPLYDHTIRNGTKCPFNNYPSSRNGVLGLFIFRANRSGEGEGEEGGGSGGGKRGGCSLVSAIDARLCWYRISQSDTEIDSYKVLCLFILCRRLALLRRWVVRRLCDLMLLYWGQSKP